MAFVLQPLSFIDSSVLVNKHTQAFSLPGMAELASIDAVFVLFYAKVTAFAYLLVVELIADHFIPFNCVTVVFKVTVVLARRSESPFEHFIMNFLWHLRTLALLDFVHLVACFCSLFRSAFDLILGFLVSVHFLINTFY